MGAPITPLDVIFTDNDGPGRPDPLPGGRFCQRSPMTPMTPQATRVGANDATVERLFRAGAGDPPIINMGNARCENPYL